MKSYPYTRPPQPPHRSAEAATSPDDQIPTEASFYMDEGLRLRTLLEDALKAYLTNRARESRYYSFVVAKETGAIPPDVSDEDLDAAVDWVVRTHGFTVSNLAEKLLEPGLDALFYGQELMTPEPLAETPAGSWGQENHGYKPNRYQANNQRLSGRGV